MNISFVLSMGDIILYGYTTFYVPIYQLMDIVE